MTLRTRISEATILTTTTDSRSLVVSSNDSKRSATESLSIPSLPLHLPPDGGARLRRGRQFHSSRPRGAPRPFRMKNFGRVGSVGTCEGCSHGRVQFGALSPYSSLTEA